MLGILHRRGVHLFLLLILSLANVPAELAWVSALTAAVLAGTTIGRISVDNEGKSTTQSLNSSE